MAAPEVDVLEDQKRAPRALDDLRRAARVLGFADEELAQMIEAARTADGTGISGGTGISDDHLVEQVKKRLVQRFHSR